MDIRMREIENKVNLFIERVKDSSIIYLAPSYIAGIDIIRHGNGDADNNFGLQMKILSELRCVKHSCRDYRYKDIRLISLAPYYREYLILQYMNDDSFDIRNNPEDEYLTMYAKILNRQFNKVRVEPRIEKWYHKFTPEILREIIKNNSKVYIKRKEEA